MWEKVKLGELCEINIGKTPSRNIGEYWGGTYKWISISDLKGDIFIENTKECITDLAIKECGIKSIPKNTLVYSFKLSIGKLAITREEIYSNEAIAALPIKNKAQLNIKFLYWAMQTLKLDGVGDKAVMGITLNKEKLKKIEIPLPPLPIQEKIAAILDKADALRRKDQELQKKYDELAQAIFIDMFGDPVKNEKGWDKNKLQNYYKNGVKCGPFGSALKKEEFSTEGIPVWNMDNIQEYEFVDVPSLFVTDEKYLELKKYEILEGDIIISRAGTVGKMCVVNSKFGRSLLSTNLIRLSLDNSNITPLFFVYLMKFFAKRLGRLKTGSEGGFTHMNTKVLDNLEIYIPPFHLQELFAKKIELINKLKAIANTDKSEELFQSLLQRTFKGELVSYEV